MPCCMQLQMAMGIWNTKSVVAILVTPFARTAPLAHASPLLLSLSLPLRLPSLMAKRRQSCKALSWQLSVSVSVSVCVCVWVWQYFCFTRFYLHLLIVYNEYLCVAECAISRQKSERRNRKKVDRQHGKSATIKLVFLTGSEPWVTLIRN